jgi:Zn-finger nucleic acid-binding protein
MSERQGIEIDYCPQCRGVWLDRGELDKLIERALSQSPAAELQRPRQKAPERPRDYESDFDHNSGDYHGDYRKKKKRGFLGELFDFD